MQPTAFVNLAKFEINYRRKTWDFYFEHDWI